MQVSIETYVSDEMRRLAESGKPIPWAQEKFHFTSDARTLIFTLDNWGRVRLMRVVVDGKYWVVETLSRAVTGNHGAGDFERRLLREAVIWLRDQRSVCHIEIFDRPSGTSQIHQVEDLIRFASTGSEE
jgi:hypothetical protein